MIWRGATLTTYGDVGRAALAIARAGDREEAQRFLDAYASEIHGWKQARIQFDQPDSSMDRDPRDIAASNIGYLSGYYAAADADLMRELFDVDHPIFGRGHPSPEEALQAGFDAASDARERLR